MITALHKTISTTPTSKDKQRYYNFLFHFFLLFHIFISSPIPLIFYLYHKKYVIASYWIINIITCSILYFLSRAKPKENLYPHIFSLTSLSCIFFIYSYTNGGLLNISSAWITGAIFIMCFIIHNIKHLLFHILFFISGALYIEFLITSPMGSPFSATGNKALHQVSLFTTAIFIPVVFYLVNTYFRYYLKVIKETMITRSNLNNVLRKSIEIPLVQFSILPKHKKRKFIESGELDLNLKEIILSLNNYRFLEKIASGIDILSLEQDLEVWDLADLWTEEIQQGLNIKPSLSGDLGYEIEVNESNYKKYIISNCIKSIAKNLHESIEHIDIHGSQTSHCTLLRIKFTLSANAQITELKNINIAKNEYQNLNNLFKIVEMGFVIAKIYSHSVNFKLNFDNTHEKLFIIDSEFHR